MFSSIPAAIVNALTTYQLNGLTIPQVSVQANPENRASFSSWIKSGWNLLGSCVVEWSNSKFDLKISNYRMQLNIN